VTQPQVFKDAREWGDLVARLFSGDAPAEIVPAGIILAAAEPEWDVLRAKLPWVSSRSVAALAANFSAVGIIPTSTERITVVRKVILINNTGVNQDFAVGMAQGIATDSTAKVASRDLRRLSVSTNAFTRQQAADLLPSVVRIRVLTATAFVLDLDWMLQAGLPNGTSALVVQTDVVNLPVAAYFAGYERRLRPEERVLD
jgi:hypothetical protein